MTDCITYLEDPCICDDVGDPKGQCVNCGSKWYEHDVECLDEEEREFVREIQEL